MSGSLSRKTALILLWGMAAVFLVAGVMKALNPSAFAEDIRNYRMVPWSANVVLALYLPWLEIFAGGALLCPKLRKGGLLLCGVMLLAFLVALISVEARGLNISCGCFGGGGAHGNLWLDILRDVAFLAVAGWLIIREAKVEKK